MKEFCTNRQHEEGLYKNEIRFILRYVYMLVTCIYIFSINFLLNKLKNLSNKTELTYTIIIIKITSLNILQYKRNDDSFKVTEKLIYGKWARRLCIGRVVNTQLSIKKIIVCYIR